MAQVPVKVQDHDFEIDTEKIYDFKVQKEASGTYRVSIVVDASGIEHPAYMTNVDSREAADTLGTKLLEAIASARFRVKR